MCGIAGWIDFTRQLTGEQATLKKMADTIEHRGPDAEGFWITDHAALAHRRLIVIDPDGGSQPMLYREGEQLFAITFNGEIYNYKELKQILEQKGHKFQTTSDTEVLLHAYIEWKEDCAKHLNGIFAFGIWDEKQQQFFMARDHLGVKPLFYAQRGQALIFGSEIKAILAHPMVDAEIDREGLAEIFAIGPMRTPGVGVFRGIHELRPGHFMVCNNNGIHIKPYWKLESRPYEDTAETSAEKIRELLIDTVKRQLQSDMPLVSMLSGGLDSSALVSIAAEMFKKEGKTLHTYSLDFVDSDKHFEQDLMHVNRDTPFVYKVSEAMGTEHHERIMDAPELVDNLLKQMYARDLPGMGEMETSLYLLFGEMTKDATVSLSGESADEVFGGYPWFYKEEFLKADTFPWEYAAAGRYNILNQEMLEHIQPEDYINRRYSEAISEVPRLEGENKIDTRRREMQYLNLTRFLPFLLDRKDRMSMAHGFEVRVPFCDYRIAEYLWNVPWEVKAVDGMEKGILRRAVKGILIDDVRTRKKSAYPFNQNPAYLQGVASWMNTILKTADEPIMQLIDKQKVSAIAEGKTDIEPQYAARLFDYLIQVNEWLKTYQIKLV
ncbi:asparagine synthase (glutamine-hydrolyzing) [Scopulibacillus cellulosilyticus]|uniref:asparagine synthase (glutamine-hydrolyzing) n=1 Tax=Scopulibacillus cellulosilyticus TaxID=2665665 RepID=A0ABW2PZ31_9BACL